MKNKKVGKGVPGREVARDIDPDKIKLGYLEARKAGEKYYIGSRCSYNHPAIRWTVSRACVVCAHLRGRGLPATTPFSRAMAIKKEAEMYIVPFKVCSNGHHAVRYTNNYTCVACADNRNRTRSRKRRKEKAAYLVAERAPAPAPDGCSPLLIMQTAGMGDDIRYMDCANYIKCLQYSWFGRLPGKKKALNQSWVCNVKCKHNRTGEGLTPEQSRSIPYIKAKQVCRYLDSDERLKSQITHKGSKQNDL